MHCLDLIKIFVPAIISYHGEVEYMKGEYMGNNIYHTFRSELAQLSLAGEFLVDNFDLNEMNKNMNEIITGINQIQSFKKLYDNYGEQAGIVLQERIVIYLLK